MGLFRRSKPDAEPETPPPSREEQLEQAKYGLEDGEFDWLPAAYRLTEPGRFARDRLMVNTVLTDAIQTYGPEAVTAQLERLDPDDADQVRRVVAMVAAVHGDREVAQTMVDSIQDARMRHGYQVEIEVVLARA